MSDVETIRFAEFEIDRSARRLLRDTDVIPLHSKTFDLLEFLAANAGRVVSKEELLANVWDGRFVEESNLVVQISHLRKALGESSGSPRFLVTVPGKGYKFVGDTRAIETVETVIEDRSVEEIVFEENDYVLTTGGRSSALGLNARRFLAAVVVILAVTGGGYFLYQAVAARPSLSSRWSGNDAVISPRQMTADGKIHIGALSPDGNFFAYTTGQSEASSLWVQSVQGSDPIEVLPASSTTFTGLTFSPDNRHVYFTARDRNNPSGALFRVPILGGMSEKVVSDVNMPVSFSSDGKQVVFVRNDRDRSLSVLVRAGVIGEPNEVEIVTRPIKFAFNQSGASWSPDGRLIATGGLDETTGANVILIVNVENGETSKLGETEWTYVRRVEWLPDGSGIFANVIEKASWQERHIWLIEFPGGAARRITRDLNRYGRESVSVSADGSKLLGVSAQTVSNVFVSDGPTSDGLRVITENAIGKRDGANNSLAWMPDGRIIVSRFFDKSETLWVMDADGANARQLTRGGGNSDRKPVVTSDGRYIVFYSYRNGSENIWRIDADGNNETQITSDGGTAPSLTPDNAWIFYQASDAIWKVPFNGGTPIRLTDEGSRSASVEVSPDGKKFATFYRAADSPEAKLAIFPIDGGDPLQTFAIPAEVAFPKMRWMPDGTSIVYCFYNSTAWRQPLSGGASGPFMEFPGEVINAFAWSNDGRRFAVSHGKEIRDVVLFTIGSN